MKALPIPHNFAITAAPYAPPYPGAEYKQPRRVAMPSQHGNPQTDVLLELLGLHHRITVPWQVSAEVVPTPTEHSTPANVEAAVAAHDPAEIDLDM
jgi:hypothetical protein